MSVPESDSVRPPARPHIRIEWASDSHDCEDCGPSYADGAMIYIEGREPIDMLPSAHCYGGTSYNQAEVYARIIEELGYTVEQVDRFDENDDGYGDLLSDDD